MKKVLLQVALDFVSFEEAQELCTPIGELADILEVGTPFILKYGLSSLPSLQACLKKPIPIFADLKIVDGGFLEAEMATEYGASLVSVLAGARIETLEEVYRACQEKGAKVVVDTVDLLPSDQEKIQYLLTHPPHYLCLHVPHDVVERGVAFLDELRELLVFKEHNLSLMVAGGLNPRILPRVLEALSPEVVVVGSAVTRSSAPEETLKLLRRLLDEYEST